TSAHDPLGGYVPDGLPLPQAIELRSRDPSDYVRRSRASMARHVRAIIEMKIRGAVAFDYGNNLRGEAVKGGGPESEPFSSPGFAPAYIRPLFCRGKGPFRWVALSGDPDDIRKTDEALLRLFPADPVLARWLPLASRRVPFQGLPSRICWLG